MAKGYKCPSCGGQTGRFENGHFQCTEKECNSIWWGPFDQPSAGEKRKGFKCPHCLKQTVHPVAELAKIKVWRCSTCASTLLEKA